MRRIGKGSIVFAAWLLLTAIPTVAAPLAEEAPKVGFKAPGFAVSALDGTNVSLAATRGKVVLLNFWATWCAPCKDELPSLVALQAAMPVTGFTVIALAQDADAKDVAKFLKKYPVNFPNGLDESAAVGRAYQVRGLPATYLIDKQGIIVERVFGPRDWNDKEWRAKIAGLLSAAVPEPPSKP